jgi:putative endopeptidase
MMRPVIWGETPMIKTRLVAVLSTALACSFATVHVSAAPTAAPVYGDWGFDAAGMDASVRPGDDFFKYANGTWATKTVIPADRSVYGVDAVLSDEAEAHVRGILEAKPRGPGVGGGLAADGIKIRAAYAAFMDQKRIDALGAAPIAVDLAAIRHAATRSDLAGLMGQAHDGFQASIFRMGINADVKAPTHYAVYIGQGGLGLPDRDYYLQPGFAKKKAAYQAYVAQLLTLAHWRDPAGSAQAIVDFETQIARDSWTRAEGRDPVKTYNPMSLAELNKAAPGFDWSRFMAGANLAKVDRVVIRQSSAIPKIAADYAAAPMTTLKAWAAFHVADAAAPYLDQGFEQAEFEFRNKLLRGQQVEQARWKRGVAFVNEGMGEAVGRIYVAEYFPGEAKAKIDDLVGRLKIALGERIDHLDWMSPETKGKARAKLAQFTVKIAYPAVWRDYSMLKVSSTNAVGDVRAFQAFEWRRQVGRMDGPVDRTEWGMTPQTVNAYYNPSQNEVVFPAAILAPPYFDPNADMAANFGGIGGVIGHEMTHGFDDQGRQYDGAGVLTDWWTKADAEKFTTEAKKLNAQYDTYSPYPGVHVKGDQTTGENIADLGGLLVALDAYHAALGGKPDKVIDGLTGDQRFFLAYAQSWRDMRREDAVRDQLVRDVHSPEIYRVNGIVRNIDAWYAAFPVAPTDKLYLAPADRVRIW